MTPPPVCPTIYRWWDCNDCYAIGPLYGPNRWWGDPHTYIQKEVVG